jgi:hypothetical protein
MPTWTAGDARGGGGRPAPHARLNRDPEKSPLPSSGDGSMTRTDGERRVPIRDGPQFAFGRGDSFAAREEQGSRRRE